MFIPPNPRLPVLLLALATLPGCFIFVDEVDDHDDHGSEPVFVNHLPFIDEGETFWLCDFDEGRQDYFFEFQTLVLDDDGWRDIDGVEVSVYLADHPDYLVGSFGLMAEGDGFWGGLVWESESDLFCGEAVDVVFEAWDSYGDTDVLTLLY